MWLPDLSVGFSIFNLGISAKNSSQEKCCNHTPINKSACNFVLKAIYNCILRGIQFWFELLSSYLQLNKNHSYLRGV